MPNFLSLAWIFHRPPQQKDFKKYRLARQFILAILLAYTPISIALSQPSEQPLIAVSIAPQNYIVKRLVGDRAQVITLLPPTVEPEVYEPGMHDLKRLAGASLFVKVGHPHLAFEKSWLGKAVRGMPIFDCSEGLRLSGDDPHIWLSLKVVERIVDRLIPVLGGLIEDEVFVVGNAAEFKQEMLELDQEIRQLLSKRDTAYFLVLHPAWGYFADEYGLKQLSIEKHGREPSPKQLAEVITKARDLGLKVVYSQPQFSQQPARHVAKELGATIVELDPLVENLLDNLRNAAVVLSEAADAGH